MALSAFLVIDAPAADQDPRLLGAEHMQRFVADIRQREREGLPSLGFLRRDGKPAIVTEHTVRDVFNYSRRLLTTPSAEISASAQPARGFWWRSSEPNNPQARMQKPWSLNRNWRDDRLGDDLAFDLLPS